MLLSCHILMFLIVVKQNNLCTKSLKSVLIVLNKTKNKKDNLKKSNNNTSNSTNTKKTEESTVSGFSAVEDEPLIVDLSSVIDSDGMGQVSVQWQISDTGNNWKNIL